MSRLGVGFQGAAATGLTGYGGVASCRQPQAKPCRLDREFRPPADSCAWPSPAAPLLAGEAVAQASRYAAAQPWLAHIALNELGRMRIERSENGKRDQSSEIGFA